VTVFIGRVNDAARRIAREVKSVGRSSRIHIPCRQLNGVRPARRGLSGRDHGGPDPGPSRASPANHPFDTLSQ